MANGRCLLVTADGLGYDRGVPGLGLGVSSFDHLDVERWDMMRRFRGAALAALTGLGVIGAGFATAETGTTRAASVKEIMGKLNKGPKSESAKLKSALAAKTPNWDAIQASTKVYADHGPELGENDPPKGSKESWKTMSEGFATQTKTLNAAAEKKDLAGTKAAFQKLSMSCMGCHRAHKPN
jgi:cytochrome c556